MFLWLLVGATVARHLSYTIGTTSLPEQLRRSLGNPYLKYAAILVMDAATLILTFSLLMPIGPAATLDKWAFMARQIFAFRSFTDFFHQPFTRDTFAVAFAAFAYYIGVVEMLLNAKEFKRNDEDVQSLAYSHLILGEYVRGLKLLSEVRVTSANSHGLNMVGYMGVGQAQKARQSASLVIQMNENRNASTQEVYSTLLGLASLFRIPQAHTLEVLSDALDEKIADDDLMAPLSGLIGTGTDVDPLLSRVAAAGKDRYPLSTVIMLVAKNRLDEAKALLEPAAPASPFGQIMRQFYLLNCRILSPATSAEEDAAVFEEWCAEQLPTFDALFLQATENQRVMIIAAVSTVALYAKNLAPGRDQQIEFMLEQMQKMAAKTPSSNQALEIMKSLA